MTDAQLLAQDFLGTTGGKLAFHPGREGSSLSHFSAGVANAPLTARLRGRTMSRSSWKSYRRSISCVTPTRTRRNPMLSDRQVESALRDADAARCAYCRGLAEHINMLADELRLRRKKRTEAQIHRAIYRKLQQVPWFWIGEIAGAVVLVAAMSCFL
jgi:hypothetical protein